MNFEFQAPAGDRIHRYFMSITVFPQKDQPSRWWSHAERRWYTEVKAPCSNHVPCRTFRAFKRHLRRHAESLKGCEVVLCNRFEGHDIKVQL